MGIGMLTHRLVFILARYAGYFIESPGKNELGFEVNYQLIRFGLLKIAYCIYSAMATECIGVPQLLLGISVIGFPTRDTEVDTT
jgi:hypothetical protein